MNPTHPIRTSKIDLNFCFLAEAARRLFNLFGYAFFSFIMIISLPGISLAGLPSTIEKVFDKHAEEYSKVYGGKISHSERELILREYLEAAWNELRNMPLEVPDEIIKLIPSIYKSYLSLIARAINATYCEHETMDQSPFLSEYSHSIRKIFLEKVKLKPNYRSIESIFPSSTQALLISAAESRNHSIHVFENDGPESPGIVVLMGESHIKVAAAAKEGKEICDHFKNIGLEGVMPMLLPSKLIREVLFRSLTFKGPEISWKRFNRTDEPCPSTIAYGLSLYSTHKITLLEDQRRLLPVEIGATCINYTHILGTLLPICDLAIRTLGMLTLGTELHWQTAYTLGLGVNIAYYAGKYATKKYFPNSSAGHLFDPLSFHMTKKSCRIRSDNMSSQILETLKAGTESSPEPLLVITGAMHTPEIGEYLEKKGFKEVLIEPPV